MFNQLPRDPDFSGFGFSSPGKLGSVRGVMSGDFSQVRGPESAMHALSQLQSAMEAGYATSGKSLNAALEDHLDEARELCRMMCHYNPYLGHAVAMISEMMLGPRGRSLSCMPIDFSNKGKEVEMRDGSKQHLWGADPTARFAIENAWKKFSEGHYWSECQTLTRMERDPQLLYSLMTDGEVFVVFDPDPDSPCGFRTRQIGAEYCPVTARAHGGRGGNFIRYGIEFTQQRKIVGYWFRRIRDSQPWFSEDDVSSLSYGAGWTGGQPPQDGDQWEFVPATRCLHMKHARFPRQYRGIPILMLANPHAFRIGLLELTELNASVENTRHLFTATKIDPGAPSLSGRRTPPPAQAGASDPDNKNGVEMGTGAAGAEQSSPAAVLEEVPHKKRAPTGMGTSEILHKEGHEMKALISAHPNPNFPGMLEAGLGGVAAALGMPLALLRSDFRQHNMSSLNLVLRMAESRFNHLISPVDSVIFEEFKRFVRGADMTGALRMPGRGRARIRRELLDSVMSRDYVELKGPSLRSIDETKAIKTAIIAARAGALSLDDIAAKSAGFGGLSSHVAKVLNGIAAYNKFGMPCDLGGELDDRDKDDEGADPDKNKGD